MAFVTGSRALVARDKRSIPPAWLVGCLAVVGILVAWQPAVAFALASGLLLASLVVVAPRVALAAALLTTLFGQSLAQATHIEMLDYADEALVVLVGGGLIVHRILSSGRLSSMRGGKWFLAYAGAGLLSAVLHSVPMDIALGDGFLFLKGPLLAFATAQIDWDLSDVRKAIRLGGGLIVFIGMATFVNLVAPGPWNALLARATDQRFGFQSLIGPFVHPGPFGQISALSLAAVLAYSGTFLGSGRQRSAIVLGAIAVMGLVLSFRRKAVMGALAAIGWIRLSVRATRLRTALVVAVVAPLAIFALKDPVMGTARATYDDYLVHSDQAARTVLYRGAISIGVDYFPLGAGFGRYGSHAAAKHYSPEYVKRHYYHVYGLEMHQAAFGSDTFWPAILGETGVLGFAAYLLGLWSVFQLFRAVHRGAPPEVRFIGLLGSAWSIEFLFESIAAPVYSSPPSYGLFFCLVGMFAALSARYLAAGEELPSTDCTDGRTA